MNFQNHYVLAQLHRGEEIYIFNRIYIMLTKAYINHIVGAIPCGCPLFICMHIKGYPQEAPLRQFRNIPQLLQGVCI